MLPGITGHLFSESFLEQHLADNPSVISPLERRELLMWRTTCASLGPASAIRTLVEVGAAPLVRALGFAGLERIEITADSSAATITGPTPPLTLIVVRWGERLDPLWRLAFQESHQRTASWCLLFNGTHVRLIETQRGYSRRYVEFDLDTTLDHDRTLAVLWTLIGARALDSTTVRSRQSLTLLAESERYAAGVSRSLKDGVLSASGSVLNALIKRRSVDVRPAAFEQALTIVYRVLFLLFAEARGLAPLWHPVYRESYSMAAMRDAAEHERSSAGLWDALRATSHMAHTGCRAGSLRVTAFNGRLFAPARTPLAERRDLDDEAARSAVLALSTRAAADRAGRERIAYRDLGVEQLGSVYETLLDFEPHVHAGKQPRSASRVVLRPGSELRKSTGTFYTPQSIAQYLTRRTLAPLVEDRSPDQILSLKILDPAMGSGAFLVKACAYLTDAYEAALVRAGECHASDLGPSERGAIRRTIAERCLYGVDLNPMAVQLARLSLWLATLAADKPLSFLDHHLQVGDSLIGAWISSLRRAPIERRRKPPAAAFSLFEESAVKDALLEALPVRFTIAASPDDSAEQVRQKERALAALTHSSTTLSKWKRVADLWCARWFSAQQTASTFRELSDVILTGRCALPEPVTSRFLEEAEHIAASRRFFHWELEFPEVFFDATGTRLPAPGFDAIIGNPPWDMIRADTGSAEARTRNRRDTSGTLRFTRDAGVYARQAVGHANRYQLFVERAIDLTRPGGRIGLVVPSGLAMDQGSAPLRRLLFRQCDIDSLVSFDNRLRVFPIHRSVRFLLMTGTRGAPTADIGCRFGEQDPVVLETAAEGPREHTGWFQVHLSLETLKRLSGDDLTVPNVGAPIDLAIAERAASLFPPLGDDRGWGVRFGRELNATEDRERLRAAGPERLPVIGGKTLEPFRLNLGQAHAGISAADAQLLLGSRHQHARLAYRDVASATNRLTLIAAILPPGCVSTHTVFCSRTPLASRERHFLCGVFNSLIVNYLVRLRVATHVTTTIVERLPIPLRGCAPGAFEEIAALARLLGRNQQAMRVEATARLNGLVGRLYQLTVEEFEHVLATFPLVPREDRDAALAAFRR